MRLISIAVLLLATRAKGKLVIWGEIGNLTAEDVCGDELVLPEALPGEAAGALLLPAEVPAEIILPANGYLLLSSELRPAKASCGKRVEWEAPINDWNAGGAWRSASWSRATPHRERIPCEWDTAEFPTGAYLVRLPDHVVRVAALHVAGEPSGPDSLRNDGRFMLNTYGDIGVELSRGRCDDPAGCQCQRFSTLSCAGVHCEPVTCSSPIQPEGHCCKLCGGELTFEAGEGFHMREFRMLVRRAAREEGDAVWHVGRLEGRRIQLVVLGVNAVGVLARMGKRVGGSARLSGGDGGSVVGIAFLLVLTLLTGVYLRYYPPQVLCRWREGSRPWLTHVRTGSLRNPLYDSRRETLSVISADDD